MLEFLKTLFNAPYIVKFLGLSCLSALIFTQGMSRYQKYPEKIFSNEAILFLGVLTTAGTIYQLGKIFDTGSRHFSILLLLSFFIYATLGYVFKSNLIWIFAIISLGGWLSAETGYLSGWGSYYFEMNYPLRFVLLGGILTTYALTFEKKYFLQPFFRSTLVLGLLYLFMSLWLMSIFGNYGEINEWYKAKQIELFHWSILFGIVALAAIFHGLRFDNNITKGFGITFIFINLYTRFFEFFWNVTHKAIFFALLAISFWLISRKAEKIWNLGRKNSKP